MKRIIFAAIVSTIVSTNASAIELQDALSLAYKRSDALKASQDEFINSIQSMPEAIAEFMPKMSAEILVQDQKTTYDSKFLSALNPQPSVRNKLTQRTVGITQPIFNGGSSVAKVKAAQAQFRSIRANLYSAEQKFLISALDAYLSAYFAKEVHDITGVSVEFRRKELASAEEKLKLGEATRTDVAAAEAGLASAEAQNTQAYANLQAANANFNKMFGVEPVDLVLPSMPNDLPETLEIFTEVVMRNNLDIDAAKHSVSSAKAQTIAAVGGLLPSANFKASVAKGFNDPESRQAPNTRVYTTAVSLQIPILARGGAEYAEIRRAKATSRRSAHNLDETLAQAKVNAIGTWESYCAYKSGLDSIVKAVAAYTITLDGVRQQYNVGVSTMIDVLKAESDLSAQKIQETDIRKRYILSAYNIKTMLGLMTAKALKLDAKYFSPEMEFKKTKRLIGF